MICQEIKHEIMAYEKKYGLKPALLVLCDDKLRDAFFGEIYEYTLKTEGADFKSPGEFHGVKFVWNNINQYGGCCKWMLIGLQMRF